MMMKKNGFTLIELAVTAIIIGILVLIGIPNLLTSTQRGYSLDAMRNLMAIYAAEQNYFQDHSVYYQDNISYPECDSAAIAAINTNLNLNIVSNGGTKYCCKDGVCKAQQNNSFDMYVDLVKSITINNVPQYADDGSTKNPYCAFPNPQTVPPKVLGDICP
jgi:prepilin-type N-terminal cleavage/methylation domain-containing protein